MAYKPIRNYEEWREFVHTRGTDGSMVFDILNDWNYERNELLKKIADLEEEVRLYDVALDMD